VISFEIETNLNKDIQFVEDIVQNILDDLADGNDSEDIIEELDYLLNWVGSRKTCKELLPI